MKILCSISTKGRYENYLPMAIMSVVNQTRGPDHLTIYDDNDKPADLRTIDVYLHLFKLLDAKNMGWNVVFGKKRGQHYNHQMANESGYDAVWRMDDDCVAEPNVLNELEKKMTDGVGAVGGSIIVPPPKPPVNDASSSIYGLDKPNKQWFLLDKTEEVDHLHCSFLYRAGIVNYDLRLSKKAHREETMFTYALKLKGYKILITPCITWHLRSQSGGIRSDNNVADYQHDEKIFLDWVAFQNRGKKLYVLNGGLGDNYMFLQAVTPPKGSVIATCYPDLYKNMEVEVISIGDAQKIVDIETHNIYAWCARNNWKGHLIDAYRKMYEN